MIKKIIGWLIIIGFVLAIFIYSIIRTMNELSCSFLMALAVTIVLFLAIVGIVALVNLAVSWIFD